MTNPATSLKGAKRETDEKVEQAARSPWTEGLARLGLVAKGVSYGIVATLALLVVFRQRSGKLTDRQGALQTIAGDPFGKILLGILAVGLFGYAIWRFFEAYLGRKLESPEEEGFLKRIGYLARGGLYATLCVVCILLVVGAESSTGGSGGGGGNQEDRATGWVLDLPLGPWIVGAIGLAVVGAGAFNGYRAVTRSFKDELKTGQMSATEERWATRVGVVGHLARMVVFTLIGIFLIRAAIQYDPNEAIGLDGALRKVAAADYGTYLLGLVAAGLAAYGLFCLVQARYREV